MTLAPWVRGTECYWEWQHHEEIQSKRSRWTQRHRLEHGIKLSQLTFVNDTLKAHRFCHWVSPCFSILPERSTQYWCFLLLCHCSLSFFVPYRSSDHVASQLTLDDNLISPSCSCSFCSRLPQLLFYQQPPILTLSILDLLPCWSRHNCLSNC